MGHETTKKIDALDQQQDSATTEGVQKLVELAEAYTKALETLDMDSMDQPGDIKRALDRLYHKSMLIVIELEQGRFDFMANGLKILNSQLGETLSNFNDGDT